MPRRTNIEESYWGFNPCLAICLVQLSSSFCSSLKLVSWISWSDLSCKADGRTGVGSKWKALGAVLGGGRRSINVMVIF